MLDTIYKTLLTIINKENQGYINPTEFNLVANNVQQEIFRGYFGDENKDKLKKNSNSTSRGYSNLAFNERQRINQFSEIARIIKTGNSFLLPENLFFLEDDGVTSISSTETNGLVNRVIEEVERSQMAYLSISEAGSTEQFPIYERYSNNILVSPDTIDEIQIRYIRTPKQPNWTYFELSSGDPVFNPANPSYQDFELHESEFTNIVLSMLSYFGINLREADVINVAETLKDKMTRKDQINGRDA